MQLTIPPDLEAIVRKRLASGAFASAEEVLRRALEVLEEEETWTADERQALDEKIDRALSQIESGRTYGPDEARLRLSQLRAAHLSNLG